MSLLGHPRLRVRLRSSEPVAILSAKLCDVFPDGTSSLLTRGLLNLTHRSSSTAPEPLPVGEWVDVDLELEAMAWDASPGHRLRLSVAGVDWPNTVAPPRPLTLTLDRSASTLVLPLAGASEAATGLPLLPPPAGDDPGAGVTWRVERDVLGRRTSCADEHGSEYEVDGGQVRERYSGRVEVATGTFAQRAEASADFTITWPEAAVRARADLVVEAGPTSYDVDLTRRDLAGRRAVRVEAVDPEHPAGPRVSDRTPWWGLVSSAAAPGAAHRRLDRGRRPAERWIRPRRRDDQRPGRPRRGRPLADDRRAGRARCLPPDHGARAARRREPGTRAARRGRRRHAAGRRVPAAGRRRRLGRAHSRGDGVVRRARGLAAAGRPRGVGVMAAAPARCRSRLAPCCWVWWGGSSSSWWPTPTGSVCPSGWPRGPSRCGRWRRPGEQGGLSR